MNLVRFYEIYLPGGYQRIGGLFDLGVIGSGAIVDPLVALHLFTAVQHPVEGVDMGMIMDARAPSLSGLPLGQAVDGEFVDWVFIENQVLSPSVLRDTVRPILGRLDDLGVSKQLRKDWGQRCPSLLQVRLPGK